MSKVKYDTNDYCLYKHKLYLPHFIGTLWLIPILCIITMIIGNDPEAAYFAVCGITAASFGFVALLSSAIAGMEDQFTEFLYFKYLTDAKDVPAGFDRDYIDHPAYQKALKAYMGGEVIGSLQPLNKEIARNIGRGDSGLVRSLAEELKITNDAFEEVRKITGG